MEKIFAIIGIILCVGVAYLFSDRKKEINWVSVGCAFIGQLIVGFLLIKTPLWKVVQWTGDGVSWLVAQASEGINFVFGGIVPEGGFVFFINSLLPIVFLSSLMGLLFHYGIIQKFVTVIGKTVAKALRVDTLVATNSVTNMFLGQTDALFITKSYLPSASESVIFSTMVSGMCSIAVSVLGLYQSYGADIAMLIVSMPLSVCSSFVMTQILMPTKYEAAENIQIDTSDKGVNALETMVNYGTSGFKSCIGIAISLMIFLSAIAMINNFIGLFFEGVTMQSVLGYVFAPFAFLMGVPKGEVMEVAQILATKLVTNETVAYGLPQFAALSINAKAMVTVALAGFSGIGSIGILIGGMSAIAPGQVKTVAKMGVKALLTASAVCMVTGSVVGLFL